MFTKFGCNFLTVSFGLTLCMLICTAYGQVSRSDELVNGSMENVGYKKLPVGWFFVSPSGGTASVDEQVAYAGERSLLIDASKPQADATQLFSNLMQSLDAQPWRGKKVRFRAAVKTAELDGAATVNLWFRVDLKPNEQGETQFGAFDNMQDRPIRDEAWKHYDIVLKVNDDAEGIVCGMFVSGKGKAWLDDVTLTEAGEDEKTSEMKLPEDLPKNVARNRPSISPQLAKALQEAENAPTQPFFTHWLWLPVVALTLFVVALSPAGTSKTTDKLEKVNWLRKFAIRFTVSYWLLYCLPNPFAALIPWAGFRLAEAHDWCEKSLVTQVARNVFRIDGELLPPNGSGDTTYNYIAVFSYFIIALLIAALWSAVDWRRANYSVTLDLLRSYLRYVLAFAMLGYGLAKINIDYNQFPINGPMQLEKTWGSSSPMNVLWAFMGASRPYTVFAGLGEVLAALLLIWRRTGSLGGFGDHGSDDEYCHAQLSATTCQSSSIRVTCWSWRSWSCYLMWGVSPTS